MRICIDARSLRDTPTGLGRYATYLVRHIAQLDQQNEFIIIRRPSHHGAIVNQANFREIFVPYDISSARNILRGARIINPLNADIYHSLFHFLPIGVRAKRVMITLHDMIWIDHPELADGRLLHRWVKGSLGKYGIRQAIRAADHMITGSASAHQVATTAHGVAPDAITTIYHGVAPEWRSGFDDPQAALPAAYQGRRFIFGLGNSLPYKNLPRLLYAFAEVAESDPDLMIVLVGRGEGHPQLVRLAQRLGLTDRVHFASGLSDAQIRACFKHALFFAFPSIIEGFGLPLLEAMASGCPVLTSNCSSLAEVTGENAELVDPLDIASISAGIRRLLADPARRQQLALQGQQRAADFTWESSAEQTLQVYHRVFAAAEAPTTAVHPAA